MSWSRAVLGTLAAIAAIVVGVVAGEVTKPASSDAGSSAPTVSAPASHRPPPAQTFLPDGSAHLFPGHRVVAYYGAAGVPALGVLGTDSATGIWSRLAAQAHEFDHHGPTVLPAYSSSPLLQPAAAVLTATTRSGSRTRPSSATSRPPGNTTPC